MGDELIDGKIQQLALMVRDKYGLDFAPDRWRDLKQAVKNFHGENDKFCSSDDCLDYILSPQAGRKDLELFINRLTIGETYFFRDPQALDVLERDILRKKSGQGSGINGAMRIWSMACATGEEPYTLAMICRRSNVRCEIFGTDIDSRALTKAHEGRYRKWSFRSESMAFRDMFFKESGINSYLIDQSVKNMVKLSRLNLIGDKIPASLMEMDVLFCRNVLMYFSADGVNLVLDKIWNCLNPGGWLLVTPSESALITAYGKFEPVNFGSVLFFRKNEDYEPEPLVFSGMTEGLGGLGGDDFASAGITESRPVYSDEDFVDIEDSITSFVEEDILSYNSPENETKSTDGFSRIVSDHNSVELGHRLREQGDNAGALIQFKMALDTDLSRSDEAQILFDIAQINADSGLMNEAELWCERAIALDRVAPQFHFLLGQIKAQQGNLQGAIAEVRNAVFLDSGFIMAHVVLGNIYMERSENAAAGRHFRISLQELDRMESDEIVPCSDGTTAGRLIEMVRLVQSNLA